MRKALLFLITFFVFSYSFSQIRIEYNEQAKLLAEGGVYPTERNYPQVSLPEYDYTELREKGQKPDPNIPFQFGKGFDMNLSLDEGKWYETSGGKTWKLMISSKGAYSLNLIFSKLKLADGARMYIYNEERNMLMGPFDKSNAEMGEGELVTDLVKGSSITIELFEPRNDPESELVISKVVHGFVDTFSAGFGQSAPCNIDIDCPEGQPFELESHAVARLLVNNGQSFCSGALVNNTCNDFTPYLLTANHCLLGNPGNYVFRFQYRSPTPRCDGQGGGGNTQVNIFYNGSQVTANHADTDFGLLLMTTRPSHENIAALGWSRNNNPSIDNTIIHHPAGDLMKIARGSNIFVSTNSDWGINFWEMTFDIGLVEGGSSGAPLINNDRLLIGQHAGRWLPNLLSCSNSTGPAFSGRFDISWGRNQNGNFLPGRNATNSLAPWLDPNNTGAMTTNTIAVPSISGPPDPVCPSSMYSTPNLPAGSTVSWAASPANRVTLSPSGNAVTVTRVAGQNGFVNLIAEINSPGCGSITLEKQIISGISPALIDSIRGPYDFPANTSNNFSVDVIPTITNYHWSVFPSGDEWIGNQGTNGINISISSPGFYSLGVDITNPCGTAGLERPIYVSGPFEQFNIYPNPASDNLTIDNTKWDAIQSNGEVYEVSLYDGAGRELMSFPKTNQKSININVRELKNGFYYIHIRYKDALIRRQIRVER